MDVDSALDVLRREAGLLAVAAGPTLPRSVPRYPDWTVADLLVHTGRIHRWVTGIVEQGATARPPRPDVDPERTATALTDWFMSGAADLALVLQGHAPTDKVWSFAADQSVGFWRRRMALETTIHRWDAQSATATPRPVPPDVATAGVTEALHVYLGGRLRGAQVGGAGQRVALRATDAGATWTVVLRADGIDLPDEPEGAPDATLSGTAEDLWLYLMGRRTSDVLGSSGDVAAVKLCGDAVALLPDAQR